MTDLSPAAQAVLDAAVSIPPFATRRRIAAALRAAADQVVPEVDLHVSVAADLLPKDVGAAKRSARYEVRRQLHDLANELESK